jgi:hypothetical protein
MQLRATYPNELTKHVRGSGLPTGIIEDLGAGIEFSHDMLTLHEPLVFAMRLVVGKDSSD